MFEVANLMNERPIGRHPSDPSEGSYLCPNNLLLDRASHKVPSGPFKEPTSIKHRHETIQQIVNSYWKKMVQQYFPSLIARQKWHVKRRNVEIGDVVMLQDSNAVRGEREMAKISDVESDNDGVVRKCEVQYRQRTEDGSYSKKFTSLKRAVQRLIVVAPVNDEDYQ